MARTITFRPSSSRSSSSSSSASSCGKFVAGSSPKKHYIRISAEKMRWYRAQEAAVAAAAAARSGSGSGSGSGPDSPTRRLRINLKRYGSS